MIKELSKILIKFFGSRNERLVKGYMNTALMACEYEQNVRQLTDVQLKAKTAEFKASLKDGKDPKDILCQAFAVMREAADRHLGIRNVFIDENGFDVSLLSKHCQDLYKELKAKVDNNIPIDQLDIPPAFNDEIRALYPESRPPYRFRHFDVQLIGGNVLYDGKIAEMATGEGKTLVATLAAYLVHLTGKKVHVVTVNDYLAKRDSQWMGPAFGALGLSVGAIQTDQDPGGEERKKQYACDITYGTNNEFGFDYLRDNMKVSIEQMAQGKLEYAIIDEVDSILIDEARTPLIISGPAFDDITKYKKSDAVVRQLLNLQSDYDRVKKRIDAAQREAANAKGELAEAKQAKDNARMQKAQEVINKQTLEMQKAELELTKVTEYFTIEIDRKAVRLTEYGEQSAQDIAGIGSFYTGSNSQWPHLLEQSLRAHVCFEKEKDYVVMDGKVIIVDEFTGRLMHGRQWSDGLHQAVEAKENVQVKEETQTLATITLQNFFKLYEQIAGMTGTAATEADEFMQIYKLDVVVIPTNQPCTRNDKEDLIYKTSREKYNAIVEEVFQTSQSGRPVLVGTVSVEKSELLSTLLTKKYGLDHEVLNAKNHAREALIVAKAGHQHKGRDGKMWGNVTIATNMAGRGTDIKLGKNVAELGGLCVIGTERHESRRIDNQLRGRAGRQGDKGLSEFFLSFDDDLLKIFMPDWTIKALTKVGWEEGEPIYTRQITKGIERAQKKVEQRNFESRKSLLEYDEVMDHQRRFFYTRRRNILEGKNLKSVIQEMIDLVLEKNCEIMLADDHHLKCIQEWARNNFQVELKANDIEGLKETEIEDIIKERAIKNVSSTISLSLGEYLQDYDDQTSWDINGLCKWAMSAFSANLSASKVKQSTPQEIEEIIIEAASTVIKKKDCSELVEFLQEGFSQKKFADWVHNKFDIKLDKQSLTTTSHQQIKQDIKTQIEAKYARREIEYPVEFAMSMAMGGGDNIYSFDALAGWAKSKYDIILDPEYLKNTKPADIYKQLVELSEKFNSGELVKYIEEKTSGFSKNELANWAKNRFSTQISTEEITIDLIAEKGREFLRKELTDLEKYVLVQIYDVAWKDHLYGMDHLKESIFLRSFAEKDPKIEYKHEGFKMFNEMLDTIEEKVTDIIFKVRLQAGERARSVWNVSNVKHDDVGQFAMSERQRAAASAPQQTEQAVKQIKLEQPKVGRNDICPCGSGKKYKKCCGMAE